MNVRAGDIKVTLEQYGCTPLILHIEMTENLNSGLADYRAYKEGQAQFAREFTSTPEYPWLVVEDAINVVED